jgi:FtsH-binding integral membrane protein
MSINESREVDNPRIKKYHQAGYGFLVINLVYLGLFYFFPPPFEPDLPEKIILTILLVGLIVYLSRLIYKEYRKVTITLAVIYAFRFIAILVFTLMSDQIIDSVPYVLTCLFLTFYLLGRAAWNWK